MEYYEHHIRELAVNTGGWLVVLAAAALTVLGMLMPQ
jgi:hypothetical protein